MTEEKLIQFKIHILGISPQISRRFVVRDSMSIAQLHHLIQMIVGWDGYFRHEFHIWAAIMVFFTAMIAKFPSLILPLKKKINLFILINLMNFGNTNCVLKKQLRYLPIITPPKYYPENEIARLRE